MPKTVRQEAYEAAYVEALTMDYGPDEAVAYARAAAEEAVEANSQFGVGA